MAHANYRAVLAPIVDARIRVIIAETISDEGQRVAFVEAVSPIGAGSQPDRLRNQVARVEAVVTIWLGADVNARPVDLRAPVECRDDAVSDEAAVLVIRINAGLDFGRDIERKLCRMGRLKPTSTCGKVMRSPLEWSPESFAFVVNSPRTCTLALNFGEPTSSGPAASIMPMSSISFAV